MTETTSHPPDICLLLRVHAEQRWLTTKVVPLLRQLERREELDVEETGPAISYLEVLWLEAGLRAAETDAAAARLDPAESSRGEVLCEKARRYHAAVRRLRRAVDQRVRAVTCAGAGEPDRQPAEA